MRQPQTGFQDCRLLEVSDIRVTLWMLKQIDYQSER